MHLSWIMLLIVSAAAKNTTVSIQSTSVHFTSNAALTGILQIGLDTIEEGSKSISVPIGDCHNLDSYEVMTVSIKKPCRFFTGPMCIGRTTFLKPGVHESDEPVPIWSVFCEDEPDQKLEL
ncbi:hypothetical protein CNMCM5793_007179 [Aspergillus hiratsukae]|uniref:Uncharacterized protein n=1 Tax=Aspergillus hiratsukae TaxID=1194566 RepID=A0A8H6QK84_9EURO|nr:hypothetical protein CNMCM5793_007179 [Aspergillus hiratsukae]KAF7174533.1 hypothetical protein CNMCM6106_009045 [Aspergillus hiratsukae]